MASNDEQAASRVPRSKKARIDSKVESILRDLLESYGTNLDESYLVIAEKRKCCFLLDPGEITHEACFLNQSPTPTFSKDSSKSALWSSTVIPHRFKVALSVNDRAWTAETYVNEDSGEICYMFSLLGEDGKPTATSKWESSPTKAYNEIYGQLFPDKSPQSNNGKLLIGCTYDNPQTCLRDHFSLRYQCGAYNTNAKLKELVEKWIKNQSIGDIHRRGRSVPSEEKYKSVVPEVQTIIPQAEVVPVPIDDVEAFLFDLGFLEHEMPLANQVSNPFVAPFISVSMSDPLIEFGRNNSLQEATSLSNSAPQHSHEFIRANSLFAPDLESSSDDDLITSPFEDTFNDDYSVEEDVPKTRKAVANADIVEKSGQLLANIRPERVNASREDGELRKNLQIKAMCPNAIYKWKSNLPCSVNAIFAFIKRRAYDPSKLVVSADVQKIADLSKLLDDVGEEIYRPSSFRLALCATEFEILKVLLGNNKAMTEISMYKRDLADLQKYYENELKINTDKGEGQYDISVFGKEFKNEVHNLLNDGRIERAMEPKQLENFFPVKGGKLPIPSFIQMNAQMGFRKLVFAITGIPASSTLVKSN